MVGNEHSGPAGERMLERCTRDGEPAMMATALAFHASHLLAVDRIDASDDAMARAVTLLDGVDGPAMELVTALVQCALVYQRRRLWELCEGVLDPSGRAPARVRGSAARAGRPAQPRRDRARVGERAARARRRRGRARARCARARGRAPARGGADAGAVARLRPLDGPAPRRADGDRQALGRRAAGGAAGAARGRRRALLHRLRRAGGRVARARRGPPRRRRPRGRARARELHGRQRRLGAPPRAADRRRGGGGRRPLRPARGTRLRRAARPAALA